MSEILFLAIVQYCSANHPNFSTDVQTVDECINEKFVCYHKPTFALIDSSEKLKNCLVKGGNK